MRERRRKLLFAVVCPLLVAAAPFIARADEPLGISEIRLVDAEEPVDSAPSQSTLVITAGDEAQPAATSDAAPELSEPAPPPVTEAKPIKSVAPKAPMQKLRRNNPPAVAPQQADSQVINNQIRPALNFYGGNPARATLSQFPRRSPIYTGAQQPIQQQIKPFNSIYQEPAISPYMNLYRDERDPENALNYFTMVRPQQDQIEANRAQQNEIQSLSRQLQGRSRSAAARQTAAPVYDNPDRSTPARYMDTAQFYGGWAR